MTDQLGPVARSDDDVDRPRPRAAIVLAGGDPVERPLPRPLPAAALVVAADSGIAVAGVLGLPVDVLIGDLDSVCAEDLQAAERAGVRIERHPVDKDRTDLALALDHAVAAGATSITVVGGHGGRLDHLAGNLALLTSPAYEQVRIVGLLGPAIVTVAHADVTLTGTPDEPVTLLAMHGAARGVSTHGLAFPLHDATLEPGSSLGLSNRFAAERARVTLQQGTVLVIQPGCV